VVASEFMALICAWTTLITNDPTGGFGLNKIRRWAPAKPNTAVGSEFVWIGPFGSPIVHKMEKRFSFGEANAKHRIRAAQV
jgi:hypothetical protein